jgi:SAM-dependent methyltransferase
MPASRSARTAPRDRDVAGFDRRAGSYERDWRSRFHALVVAGSVEVALRAVPQPAGLAEVARVLRPDGRLVLVDLFAIGWLRPITALGRRRDRVHTTAETEAMLAAAGLAPLGWRRVFDLGPLPLVRAVVAARG